MALLERETARRSGDFGLCDRLAEAYMKFSRVSQRRRDMPAGIEAARKAIAVLEAIPASFDPAHFEKLSRMYAVLAEVQGLSAGQSIPALQEALATSQKSRDVLLAGGRRSSESWLLSYSGRSARIGYALDSMGERTGDPAWRRQALQYHLEAADALREVIAASPEGRFDRALADGNMTIGLTRWEACRDFTTSLREVEQARDEFQRLSAREPHNLELKCDLANAWAGMGRILGEARHRNDALAASRRALAIYEELGRADPASGENAEMIAQERSRIAALERAAHSTAMAAPVGGGSLP